MKRRRRCGDESAAYDNSAQIFRLEVVVSAAPSEAHAVGLATCSGAWCTTEDLLERTVGRDAARVSDWLAGQPMVARGPRGLILHDLAREVLEAEFERRSPERHRRLHRVIHDHVVAEVRATGGFDRQHSAQQLLFLHRRSQLTSTFWSLLASGSAAVVLARPADYPRALAINERFEGPASADLARDDFGADLREFTGADDHVHLLVHYPPSVAISRLVNSLKGVSSRRLRAAYLGRTNRATMHGHLWSPSYVAGPCGGAPLAVVTDYIAQQQRPD